MSAEGQATRKTHSWRMRDECLHAERQCCRDVQYSLGLRNLHLYQALGTTEKGDFQRIRRTVHVLVLVAITKCPRLGGL